MSNTDEPGAGRRGRGAGGTGGTRTGSRTGGAGTTGTRAASGRGAAAGAGATPMPPTGASPGGLSTGATGGTLAGSAGASTPGGATSGAGGASRTTAGATAGGAATGTTSAAPARSSGVSSGTAGLSGAMAGTSMRATGTPHFHYSLISWGSVIAGAVIAVVTGAMLNLFGVAIGALAADAASPGAGEMTVFGGLWLALSTVIGLVVGGYVAARAAANPDHHEGALHGAAVWAVSFLVALFLTGSLITGTAFSAIQAAGAAVEEVRGPATEAAREATTRAGDNGAAAQQRAAEVGERAAEATAGAAFWGFLTMLTGLIGAMIGGLFGARSDHGHRPRRSYSDVI